MPRIATARPGSSMCLKEAIQIVKDAMNSQADMTLAALGLWLSVVEQLPQHPPNPHTAAAVQLAHAAYKEGRMSERSEDGFEGSEGGVAWLKDHLVDVSEMLSEQLNAQRDITIKRLEILQQLRSRLEQQGAGEQQSVSSQLTAQTLAEEQGYIMLKCALRAYKTIGPVAAMTRTLKSLERMYEACTRHKHDTLREKYSCEVGIVNALFDRMAREMCACIMVANRFDEQRPRLSPSKRLVNGLELSAYRRIELIEAAAGYCWMKAALMFPVGDKDDPYSTGCIVLAMVNWDVVLSKVMCGCGRYNTQMQGVLSPLVCDLLTRNDLRASLEDEAIRRILSVCRIPTEQVQALRLPQAVRKELLVLKEQAAASQDSTSGEECTDGDHDCTDCEEGACCGGGGGDSSGDCAAAVTVEGGGLGNMQDLLEMMYGFEAMGITKTVEHVEGSGNG